MKQYARIVLLCLAIITAWSDAQTKKHPRIGVNVSYAADFATQIAFVDIMKTARYWIHQNVGVTVPWSINEPLDLDEHFWVKSLASGRAAATILMTELQGHYPAGEYICLYDGEGQMEFGWDATVVSSTTGRIVLNVTPSNAGIFFKINGTNPANYLRNVRILMPGHEQTYVDQPFYPPFLEYMSHFSVLRFMWWGNIPYTQQQQWSQRASVDDFSWCLDAGIPFEIMAKLSNAAKADIWICVPHLVDSNYSIQLGLLMSQNLDPSRTLYIEHSNEVWNGGAYAAYHWAVQQGQALGLASDAGNNDFIAAMRFHSQRSVQIFNWVGKHFTDTTRLVRVMGGWTGNDFVASLLLSWNNASQYTDALAIAPYFGGLVSGYTAEQLSSFTAEQILDTAEADMQRAISSNISVKAAAQQFGVELLCYESGQHLVHFSPTPKVDSLLQSANRHPRMYDIYKTYYQRWDSLIGGLNVVYSSCEKFSRYGSWGLKEYLLQPDSSAPKWRALRDIINSYPTSIASNVLSLPAKFELQQNFPNPFNPITTIQFTTPFETRVKLKIFDLLGREVATLVDGELPGGDHRTVFDAKGFASGIYFYRLEAGTMMIARKLILLR